MADVKISDLPSLSQASLDAATDVLPIVDTSLNLTSKITANAVVKNVLQNPGPIGAGTPDSGAFTTLDVSGAITSASINFGQNDLNYFEADDWTPTLKFSTMGDLSVGYSSQIGSYTRIGRQVTVHGRVEGFLTYTTASGVFYIDGLPFSPNATQRYFVGVCTKAGFTAPNAGGVVIRTDPNIFPNGLYIEYQTTTSASPFTNTQITTGTTATLLFTITYFV